MKYRISLISRLMPHPSAGSAVGDPGPKGLGIGALISWQVTGVIAIVVDFFHYEGAIFLLARKRRGDRAQFTSAGVSFQGARAWAWRGAGL